MPNEMEPHNLSKEFYLYALISAKWIHPKFLAQGRNVMNRILTLTPLTKPPELEVDVLNCSATTPY